MLCYMYIVCLVRSSNRNTLTLYIHKILINKLHGAASFLRSKYCIHSTSHEIPCLLQNLKVHDCVHRNLSLMTILERWYLQLQHF
jgi:hypothetical protein